MTSAARPTYNPTAGSGTRGFVNGSLVSRAYSSKDLPGQLTMKVRQAGQGTTDEIAARDLKAELERREAQHYDQVRKEKEKELGIDTDQPVKKLDLADVAQFADADADDDDDDDDSDSASDGDTKQPKKKQARKAASDDDDEDDDDDDDDDSDDDEDDDEEDDEDDELMRELAKIKAEREAARLAKERDELLAQQAERERAAMTGNPLLVTGGSSNARVKRRWDEDCVFKNQARTEIKPQKRFINDVIRSDFHRRFIEKYIR